MINSLKALSTTQKARLISFLLITALVLYIVLGQTWGFRIEAPAFSYTDNLNMDGEDFSPIANLFIAGANGIISFLSMIVTVTVTCIATLCLILPWKIISLRSDSTVKEAERDLIKYTWIGFVLISVIGCIFILRFTGLVFILNMTGFPALFLWLFGVSPIRKKYAEQEAKNSHSISKEE